MARTSQRNAQAAREAFKNYLRRNDIRFTAPRRDILDAVLLLREHFEAEQVLQHLRDRGRKVGKATVYRTLPLLVDAGILKQVRFDVKQAHYKFSWGEDPHDHMVCRRCGRIVEFGSEEVIALRDTIARRTGFHAISHRFQISGLCRECVQDCPIKLVQPLATG